MNHLYVITWRLYVDAESRRCIEYELYNDVDQQYLERIINHRLGQMYGVRVLNAVDITAYIISVFESVYNYGISFKLNSVSVGHQWIGKYKPLPIITRFPSGVYVSVYRVEDPITNYKILSRVYEQALAAAEHYGVDSLTVTRRSHYSLLSLDDIIADQLAKGTSDAPITQYVEHN